MGVDEDHGSDELSRSEREILLALVEGLYSTGMGVDIVDSEHKILFQNQ